MVIGVALFVARDLVTGIVEVVVVEAAEKYTSLRDMSSDHL